MTSVATLIDKLSWLNNHHPGPDAGAEKLSSYLTDRSQVEGEVYRALCHYGPLVHDNVLWYVTLPPRKYRVNSTPTGGPAFDKPWPPEEPETKPSVEKVLDLNIPQSPG